MASPAAVRLRLEGYARGKIASILQPLSERLLVEQPQASPEHSNTKPRAPASPDAC